MVHLIIALYEIDFFSKSLEISDIN